MEADGYLLFGQNLNVLQTLLKANEKKELLLGGFMSSRSVVPNHRATDRSIGHSVPGRRKRTNKLFTLCKFFYFEKQILFQ